jgi:hypothetical protein
MKEHNWNCFQSALQFRAENKFTFDNYVNYIFSTTTCILMKSSTVKIVSCLEITSYKHDIERLASKSRNRLDKNFENF